MTITNHRLTNADWVPTKHRYRKIKPTLAVIHESGTRIGKGLAVGYCKRNKRKVAYHVLIERDGTVVQMAEFNRKTNHAGRSEWNGRKWCNNFSVGIALVGPTELKGTEEAAVSYYGKMFTSKDGISKGSSKYHGTKHIWLKYTNAQLRSLNQVVADLREAYPGIDIAGHYHVSPGRKIDPSPLLNIHDLGVSEIELDREEREEMDAFLGEKEVAHGKDVGKFKRTSRKMRFMDKAKKVILGSVPAGAFSWATFEKVQTFVNDYAGIVLLVLGVAAYLTFRYLEVKQEEDYVEGRYEPSEYEGKEDVE